MQASSKRRITTAALAVVAGCSLATVVWAEAAPKALSDALAAALREDSRTWIFNRLDSNSIQAAQIVSRANGQVTIRTTYTQNGGRPAWVQGRFSGSRLICVEFHDAGGNCRQVITYAQVHGSQPSGATSIRYAPMADSTGSRACLQWGLEGGSATTYRTERGDHVRTDRHSEIKVIKNTCNRTLSYDLNVGSTSTWGGSRPTRFSIGPNQSHRYVCYFTKGQTAMGNTIEIQTNCTRQ